MSMRWIQISQRLSLWVAALVLGSALSVAPQAFAGSGKGRSGKNVGNHCENRHPQRHRESERHRHAKRAPRPVYQQHSCYVPRASSMQVIRYHDRPFYFSGELGVYFDSGVFSISIGNTAPRGYAYYDPYCNLVMGSVAAYRSHLCNHDHRALIEVVCVGGDRSCR